MTLVFKGPASSDRSQRSREGEPGVVGTDLHLRADYLEERDLRGEALE